jgi:Reverse transcriptase (RNA-dependent DNA polymerase)
MAMMLIVLCSMPLKRLTKFNIAELIRLLLIKKLPVVVIRFLLNIYLFQTTRVAWNRSYSQCFKISNGVRQGAVLSPVLFCIYFNELLHALELARCGGYIGCCSIEVLANADYLVLLAPSASATRRLLKICDKFGESYSVIFNANKSKCLMCSSPKRSYRIGLYEAPIPIFYIGGNVIELANEWPHLGHIISNSCDDESDVTSRK